MHAMLQISGKYFIRLPLLLLWTNVEFEAVPISQGAWRTICICTVSRICTVLTVLPAGWPDQE